MKEAVRAALEVLRCLRRTEIPGSWRRRVCDVEGQRESECGSCACGLKGDRLRDSSRPKGHRVLLCGFCCRLSEVSNGGSSAGLGGQSEGQAGGPAAEAQGPRGSPCPFALPEQSHLLQHPTSRPMGGFHPPHQALGLPDCSETPLNSKGKPPITIQEQQGGIRVDPM